MNTRIATKSDVNSIRDMWENSRGGGIFTQWFFDKVFYSGNSVIAEVEGDIAACSCTVPYKVNINGAELDASYIGAIVANPENRIPDTMNLLMADTLSFINSKSTPVVFTVPDNYKFFEKYGFSLCYEYNQYNITPCDLPSFGINGNIIRPKTINKEVIDMISPVYEKFTRKKNGYTLRSEDDWKLIFDDFYKNFNGKCVIYKNYRNEILGYMLYIIRDNKMGIYELAYSKREGYEGLIGFIKSHEEIVNQISLKMPSDDLLYLNLCDSRMAISKCPFAMARIIDVKTILQYFAQNAPENIRLQVVDRIIESNNRTFTFNQGDVLVIDDDSNVATDIGTLTQIVLGYLSVEEAFSANLIKGDISLLKTVFEKQTTYINMLCV